MPELQTDSVLPQTSVAGITQPKTIPSRTWRVAFPEGDEQGHITNEEIDGVEAVRQAAALALLTCRFKSPVFSTDYGSEIDSIIAWTDAPQELVKSELERTVRETLSMDERITDIRTITVELQDDNAHIEVPISTIFGDTRVEVII